MEFKVILTPRALADLEDILGYIAKENPAAAQQLHSKLHQEASGLRRFPLRGLKVRRYTGVRFIVCGKYLIVYWVKNRSVVQVLRFWHTARDIRRLRL